MTSTLRQKLLTIPEVADELRVSESTVRREIAAGRLASTVVGKRSRRVTESEVEAYKTRGSGAGS